MTYTPDQVAELRREHSRVLDDLPETLHMLLAKWWPTLTNPRAKEYLTHGVCRRITIIRRCIEQVFTIFPPDRTVLLSRDERSDVEIALHAFFINVHGALDNLAWVVVLEKCVTPPKRRDVGLRSKVVRPLLWPEASAYLHDPKIEAWLLSYSANYRDALAHRIPLYVPPSNMTDKDVERYRDLEEQMTQAAQARDFARANELLEEQQQIGSISPVFAHSFWDSDAASPTYFHPQLIADGRTLMEIVRRVAGLDREPPSHI
jgi:hypothetical protein